MERRTADISLLKMLPLKTGRPLQTCLNILKSLGFEATCFDIFVARVTMAVFSRVIFQVAERVRAGNVLKTVARPGRLKLSESANFNGIFIKFKPPNQVA